jgi:uncharacterized protein Yka (UPF0111/DUF47 family)
VKRAFGDDIPLKQRSEWEAYLSENTRQVRALTDEIEKAEREIDKIVYRLFDLLPTRSSCWKPLWRSNIEAQR